MSTKGLGQIIREWATCIKSTPTVKISLRATQTFLWSLVMHPGKSVFFKLAKELPNLPSVVYICARVGEAVFNTSIALGAKTTSSVSWSYALSAYLHVADGMRERRWCPSTNAILNTVTTTMYASMLMSHTLHGHDKCTAQICVANSVDPSTDVYVTKHVSDSCQCQFQIPVLAEVAASSRPISTYKRQQT